MVFDLLQADLSAILESDGQSVLYRRNGSEVSLKVLPYGVDRFDERVGEGDILAFLIKDDDLGAFSPPKYGDQVVFITASGEEVWEVMGTSFIRPGFWRIECGSRFNPRPNTPNRT